MLQTISDKTPKYNETKVLQDVKFQDVKWLTFMLVSIERCLSWNCFNLKWVGSNSYTLGKQILSFPFKYEKKERKKNTCGINQWSSIFLWILLVWARSGSLGSTQSLYTITQFEHWRTKCWSERVLLPFLMRNKYLWLNKRFLEDMLTRRTQINLGLHCIYDNWSLG